jgi:hypothetical protein
MKAKRKKMQSVGLLNSNEEAHFFLWKEPKEPTNHCFRQHGIVNQDTLS